MICGNNTICKQVLTYTFREADSHKKEKLKQTDATANFLSICPNIDPKMIKRASFPKRINNFFLWGHNMLNEDKKRNRDHKPH